MAHGNLVISEILCYAIRKYGITPNDSLKAIIGSFYTDEEISSAKDQLFASGMELNVADLPNKVRRRNTPGKKKLEIDDIFAMIDFLDEKQIISKLPKFVAADLARIPPFDTDDLDVCRLAIRLAELEAKVTNFLRVANHAQVPLDNSRDNGTKPTASSPSCDLGNGKNDFAGGSSSVVSTLPSAPKPSRNHVNNQVGNSTNQGNNENPQKASFAEIACTLADKKDGWTTTQSRKQKSKKILGSSDQILNLSAAKEYVSKAFYYVGNLAESTSAEEITQHLQTKGVKVISCFDSKSSGKVVTSKAKAFRVCVDKRCNTTVLESANWPKDVIVRPWMFKTQDKPAAKAADLQDKPAPKAADLQDKPAPKADDLLSN